jgi:ADP-heptose:LPS heptosyltransferase
MSDILFIKTSSLGDVIHHMPAVTDARRHRPQAKIGWVVEEAFAPLVAAELRGGYRHPRRLAPLAHRPLQRGNVA